MSKNKKFSIGIKVPISNSNSNTTTTSTTCSTTTTTSPYDYYDNMLDNIPLKYIENYLRRKKIKNINK